MTKPFSYSVLKYRPSYLLDERINLGLLFSFPKEEKFGIVSQMNRACVSIPSNVAEGSRRTDKELNSI